MTKSPFFTNIELEWGESSVNQMIEELYTADEIKDLKNARIDPASGILVVTESQSTIKSSTAI